MTGNLDAFRKWLDGKPFTLSRIIPIPEELVNSSSPFAGDTPAGKALIAVHGAADWYTWCIKNWGTKWDIDAYSEEPSNNEIVYEFDSAWSPPIKAIETLSKLFPSSLQFKLVYCETGVGFAGVAQIMRGEVEDVCYNSPDPMYQEIANNEFGFENDDEDDDEEEVEYIVAPDAVEKLKNQLHAPEEGLDL